MAFVLLLFSREFGRCCIGYPLVTIAMQRIQLRDSPGQKREVEDGEVIAQVREIGVAKNYFVDNRRQAGFHHHGRIEEVLKGRACLAGLMRIHGESGTGTSSASSRVREIGGTPEGGYFRITPQLGKLPLKVFSRTTSNARTGLPDPWKASKTLECRAGMV